MPEYLCIGIDPGVSGGIVGLFPDGKIIATPLESMNRYDVRSFLLQMRTTAERRDQIWKLRVLIERVGGFIGESDTEGKRSNVAAAHTTFTLGESYGQLTMAMVCLGLSFQEVLPKEWQKHYGMKRLKGEKKPAFKNRLKAKARELFPKEKITLATSDAYLLAHLCRARNS